MDLTKTKYETTTQPLVEKEVTDMVNSDGILVGNCDDLYDTSTEDNETLSPDDEYLAEQAEWLSKLSNCDGVGFHKEKDNTVLICDSCNQEIACINRHRGYTIEELEEDDHLYELSKDN